MVEFPSVPRIGIQPIQSRLAGGQRGHQPGIESPIGIFDSGVGGLTVLSEVMRLLPAEDVIYLADTARVPYGGRSPNEILRINLEIMHFMVDSGVKMVIMACGTSSSIAYPVLRDRYQIPVIGMVGPAVQQATEASRNGKIGLIATESTVAAGFFQNSLREKNQSAEIIAIGCPLFVPMVEGGFLETPETERIALEYLTPILQKGADTLILGCTHYPHLTPLITKIMGPAVALINPAKGVVEEAVATLRTHKLLRDQNPSAQVQYVATGPWRAFQELGTRLLGKNIPNVRQAVLKRA